MTLSRFQPLLLLLCSGLLLGACRRSSFEEVSLDLEKARQQAQAGAGSRTLRFGLATMISPRQTAAAYETVVRELGTALRARIELVHGKSYREVNRLLTAGRLDLAFICTGGYIELLQAEVRAPLLAVPSVAGKTTYQSMVIVRKESPVRSFSDLKGARFVFVDPLSLTGFGYPATRVKRLGLELEGFFASTEFLGSHDRAIQAVRRGAAEAAAVDSLVYYGLRPSEVAGLRVLEISPELGIPPLVAAPRTPPRRVAEWQHALLELHELPTVAAALRELGIDRFVEAPPELYDSAVALWREVSATR